MADRVDRIETIFRRSLNILEHFTINNKTNQDLMWKYKEKFVFPELGKSEHDGELNFVYAIIDGNNSIPRAKSLSPFVKALSQRMGHQANFVVLLEIYNKLMDFESMGNIKQSLIKLILDQPLKMDSKEQTSRQDFEAAINVKEILFHILDNKELNYTRDAFKNSFPLNDIMTKLIDSIETLDQFEEDDDDYDAQDYEELRECQQRVIVNIYSNLHFNKNEDNLDITEIIDCFSNIIGPAYEDLLDKYLEKVDFSNKENFRMSEIKLIVIHLQILIKNIKA